MSLVERNMEAFDVLKASSMLNEAAENAFIMRPGDGPNDAVVSVLLVDDAVLCREAMAHRPLEDLAAGEADERVRVRARSLLDRLAAPSHGQSTVAVLYAADDLRTRDGALREAVRSLKNCVVRVSALDGAAREAETDQWMVRDASVLASALLVLKDTGRVPPYVRFSFSFFCGGRAVPAAVLAALGSGADASVWAWAGRPHEDLRGLTSSSGSVAAVRDLSPHVRDFTYLVWRSTTTAAELNEATSFVFPCVESDAVAEYADILDVTCGHLFYVAESERDERRVGADGFQTRLVDMVVNFPRAAGRMQAIKAKLAELHKKQRLPKAVTLSAHKLHLYRTHSNSSLVHRAKAAAPPPQKARSPAVHPAPAPSAHPPAAGAAVGTAANRLPPRDHGPDWKQRRGARKSELCKFFLRPAGCTLAAKDCKFAHGIQDAICAMCNQRGHFEEAHARGEFPDPPPRKHAGGGACRHGIRCLDGTQCSRGHTDFEREMFKRNEGRGYPKWKTMICGKLKDGHPAKWCKFAHADEELYCRSCRSTGHAQARCPRKKPYK